MTTIAHAAAAQPHEDQLPLEHALGIAMLTGAKVVSVHAGSEPGVEARMLAADDIVRNWPNRRAVVHERIVHTCCEDPVDTTLDALKKLEPVLVVVGTHSKTGLGRLLLSSRAEAIAENVSAPTLVVPAGSRPFVVNGRVKLERVLIPAGDAASAEAACDALAALLWRSELPPGQVTLLGVGAAPAKVADLALPEGWTCTHVRVEGDIAHAIAKAAQDADLVVMSTRGHDTLMDTLVGTHTEKVFHESPCPVLSVPMQK